ncbi:ATP-binding protein [Streptomyces sp. WAC06614]|uniref:ATP-binding protein n=1 Tax=Streptomyces sp. WAC06614 TaxID=2487416 RepID=UPI000F7689A4|nr:ATP-binding protein [Streptomyces sp. WAC06614]RSS78506.1 ATP-binding protein [Streptomyces sp. WAC06614]
MEPRAVGGLTCEQARGATRAVLAAHGVTGTDADDALLVVTELVANARRHAGGVTGFHVSCHPPRAVIEVADASPADPVDRPTPPSVPGRFGWVMINQLTEHVNVDSGPDGKTISVVVVARTAEQAAARPGGATGDGRR